MVQHLQYLRRWPPTDGCGVNGAKYAWTFSDGRWFCKHQMTCTCNWDNVSKRVRNKHLLLSVQLNFKNTSAPWVVGCRRAWWADSRRARCDAGSGSPSGARATRRWWADSCRARARREIQWRTASRPGDVCLRPWSVHSVITSSQSRRWQNIIHMIMDKIKMEINVKINIMLRKQISLVADVCIYKFERLLCKQP